MPLARFLYIYINKPPSRALAPLTHELIKLVQSKRGQEIMVKVGYFPITAAIAQEALDHVQ